MITYSMIYAIQVTLFMLSIPMTLGKMYQTLSIGLNHKYQSQTESTACIQTLCNKQTYFSPAACQLVTQLHPQLIIPQSVSMCEELPEQLLAAEFIKPGNRVLELGTNYGRNTLLIAKLIEKHGHLDSSEQNTAMRESTKATLKKNKIHNTTLLPAISKHPLKQISQGNPLLRLDNYTVASSTKQHSNQEQVPTIPEPPSIHYDVLVADCEGCALPLLQENPQILKHISTILLENDYWSNYDENFDTLHNILKQAGFKSTRCLNLNSHNCFYEVLQHNTEQ